MPKFKFEHGIILCLLAVVVAIFSNPLFSNPGVPYVISPSALPGYSFSITPEESTVEVGEEVTVTLYGDTTVTEPTPPNKDDLQPGVNDLSPAWVYKSGVGCDLRANQWKVPPASWSCQVWAGSEQAGKTVTVWFVLYSDYDFLTPQKTGQSVADDCITLHVNPLPPVYTAEVSIVNIAVVGAAASLATLLLLWRFR